MRLEGGYGKEKKDSTSLLSFLSFVREWHKEPQGDLLFAFDCDGM